MDKYSIPIVFATDDKYSKHLGVAICSLLDNQPEDIFYEIFVLHSNLSLKSRERLEIVAQQGCCSLVFKSPKKNLFKNAVEWRYISKTTYYRLVIPSLFPNYEKIIYLDADIVVLSSLKSLWEKDFQERSVVGFNEIYSSNRRKTSAAGLHYGYFNAGVLLLNLKKLRKINFEARALVYLSESGNKFIYGDQDILNKILFRDWVHLPFRYNIFSILSKYHFGMDHRKDEYRNAIKKPVIIHYLGEHKPDSIKYIGWYAKIYRSYLHKTPWQNSRMKDKSFVSIVSYPFVWGHFFLTNLWRMLMGRFDLYRVGNWEHPEADIDCISTNHNFYK